MSVTTSAPTTSFVSETIYGPLGYHLYLDGNQKISGWDPKPNAFSLLQIKDCPGATPSCKAACYVHNLEKHAPDVHRLYQHNSETIRKILDSDHLGWALTLGKWIQRKRPEPGFRWHVSGDVFSAEYAEWIVKVCNVSPSVNHWIYTRSFRLLPILARARNLKINVSADKDNYREAIRESIVRKPDGSWEIFPICYMSDDGRVPMSTPDVLFMDYGFRRDENWRLSLPVAQRTAVCPVDFYGKSESIRCGVCTKCL